MAAICPFSLASGRATTELWSSSAVCAQHRHTEDMMWSAMSLGHRVGIGVEYEMTYCLKRNPAGRTKKGKLFTNHYIKDKCIHITCSSASSLSPFLLAMCHLLANYTINSSFCSSLRNMMSSQSLNADRGVNLAVVSVHGIFSAVGIAENALVLWVVGFRVRWTVSAVWVLNLALSDFLATLTLPLFTFYLYSSHTWELGQPLCVVQSTIFFLNMFVSAFLLAAISLDRCLLVLRPIWSKQNRSVSTAWLVCGLGWMWAMLNALPYAVFRRVTIKPDCRKLCYHNFALYPSPSGLEWDCWLRQGATALSKFLLAFLVPLGIIALSYTCLDLRLRQRNRRRQKSPAALPAHFPRCSTPGPASLSPRFSRMLVAAILVFIVCWSPYHAVCLLEMAVQDRQEGMKAVEVGLPAATTMSFMSAVLNPILYTFSCPQFCVKIRESLAALMEGLIEEGGEEACIRGGQLFRGPGRDYYQCPAKISDGKKREEEKNSRRERINMS
ncbi:hypothetical protein JZ751_008754, partial [Albula glossodonta]